MALPLAGKHCAVVGATGIIGFSIAKAFAQQGAVLTLLARSAADARPRLEPQLRPYSLPGTADHDLGVPAAHRFIRLDVADRESIKALQTGTTVGPVDILVNCAGITQTSLLMRTSDEHLSDIVDTNLLATILVCKHAKMRPNGCIINVSSLMATKGGLGASAYAASKAGVIGFTRALCREMASRSIRVNALLPGWVNSSMWTGM
ncbi:NAD(P)-binding protein [Trichoderma longibrachiatum ATCC 18648]|uniref:NAD(P)-binding protein n=1 Tax=Trichoderma longibrachiatum ATCC 18648 TaxID=983965 RepID=A0A2T4C2U3_TRILO|nr:NAD(P)-binding protein [Trichoderma longibrachiatum ATCC 18648]